MTFAALFPKQPSVQPPTPSLRYEKVDVFTDSPFGGNPLAVFAHPPELTDAQMLRLARELNLSETTFVGPSLEPDCAFRVRIFTPARELPMAGHPTVGTVFVLHRLGLIPPDSEFVRLEEGVGPIPVTLAHGGANLRVTMTQPQPEFGAVIDDRAAVARMLSLEPDEMDGELPIQVVGCGVPFLFVPLVSLQACARSRIEPGAYVELLGPEPPEVFVFGRQTLHARARIHGRMYAPQLGIAEDAATGGAAGPLGCYLQRYAALGGGDAVAFTLEQGIEMGRPSFLHVAVQCVESRFLVRVGGDCVYMGAGNFEHA